MCTCGWWRWLPLHSLAAAQGALHLVESHWDDPTAKVNVMGSHEYS